MKKISRHLSYKEAINSQKATEKGLDNTPNSVQMKAMQITAHAIFELCRAFVGGALAVTSFFRSFELNKAIGGSVTSQHCNGEAIDMDAQIYGRKTNAALFHYIKTYLSFDQLIWEFGTDEEPDWIHASYVSEDINRGQILKAIKVDGKTKYVRL